MKHTNKKPAGSANYQTGRDAELRTLRDHLSAIKAKAKPYNLAILRALPDMITGVLVLVLIAIFLETMP